MSANGEKGAKVLIPATPATPAGVTFYSIQALEASTLTATESPEDTTNGDASFSGSIPAGSVIFGNFSAINLSAGRVRAYLK